MMKPTHSLLSAIRVIRAIMGITAFMAIMAVRAMTTFINITYIWEIVIIEAIIIFISNKAIQIYVLNIMANTAIMNITVIQLLWPF